MTDDHGPDWYERMWRELIEGLSRDPEMPRLPPGSMRHVTVVYNFSDDAMRDLDVRIDFGQSPTPWRSPLVLDTDAWHGVAHELLNVMPQTPEEADQVQQAVAEVTASPEHRELIRRVTRGIGRADGRPSGSQATT